MSILQRDERGMPIAETGEIIPGMAAQGEGIKSYVRSEYAPLKACLVANPSASWMANGQTWEYANMFAGLGDEFNEWVTTYGGTELAKTDPETWEQMALESDALGRRTGRRGSRSSATRPATPPTTSSTATTTGRSRSSSRSSGRRYRFVLAARWERDRCQPTSAPALRTAATGASSTRSRSASTSSGDR